MAGADIVIRLNNIITIKGVHLSDLENLDALYEKRPINTHDFVECIREGSYTSYSTIPKKFTHVDEWPKMTNLKCHQCSRNFTTYPKFIPTCPERVFKGRHEETHYTPKGNFCTWNCVIGYIYDTNRIHRDNKWDYEKNAIRVASLFEKRKLVKIMPSPPKTEMKQYCGEFGLTEQEYQKKIDKLNADYDLSCYKIEQLRDI